MSCRKGVHWLVMIGALGACHDRARGIPASQVIDVTQAPSATPSSQPPFQTQGGGTTITPEADYTASGIVGITSPKAWGEFSITWGPGIEKLPPNRMNPSAGQGAMIVVNVSDDKNIVLAIRQLEMGQHVRVTGWRSTMARGGNTMGPTMKLDGADGVAVYPTELQIGDTLYVPTALPK